MEDERERDGEAVLDLHRVDPTWGDVDPIARLERERLRIVGDEAGAAVIQVRWGLFNRPEWA